MMSTVLVFQSMEVLEAPTVTDEDFLKCAGCSCSKSCDLAKIADSIEHNVSDVIKVLGNVLDFTENQSQIRELKRSIAFAMQNISIHSAHRVLDKVMILPRPSSYTLATSAGGYAVIFVVGENYTTHPVLVNMVNE